MIYDLPPMLSGSPEQQIKALRDYLVRIARRDHNEPVQKGNVTVLTTAGASGGGLTPQQKKEIQDSTAALRALIIKTADLIYEDIDELALELHGEYLAISDFGNYRESLEAQFEATARAVVESYNFESELNAINQRFGGIDSYLTTLRGEIRRGFIQDPETGEIAFGIAIAESLSVTGQVVTEAGLEYWELSPGQTLGIYTSTGWQFWINGSKRGWFDSQDSQLHVSELAAESGIRLGADWLMTATNGFGLRYIGG